MGRRRTSKQRRFEPGEVAAARELYMRLGPRKDWQILKAMQAEGYRNFKLQDLADRPDRNWRGMAKEYGWEEEYQRVNSPEREPALVVEDAQAEPVPVAIPDDFQKWLEMTEPKFTWSWPFQRMIFDTLGRMTGGLLQRLMIFMPPRHGKSELVTIRYAAWRLLRDPKLRIVIASYNQKLANKFSRRVRRLYEQWSVVGGQLSVMAEEENHPGLRPPLLRKEGSLANTIDEWETASGGGVKAVGAGAGITGFGADLIIIDDPIKGRADAESANNRERVWDWYTDDLHTRLEPNGAVILIQTRWHEDDLAGRLLNAERGVRNAEWEVIRLPALAEGDEIAAKSREKEQKEEKNLSTKEETTEQEEQEGTSGTDGNPQSEIPNPKSNDPIDRDPGQALCPERFSREALLKIREQMGSYKFDALYQQDPVPAANCLFKREWFSNVVDAAPAGLRWYRGYDLAVSTKTTADYTASFRVAFDKATGILYVADGMRARLEFPDQRQYIISRLRNEPDTEHGIEEALHGQGIVQDLLREEGLGRFAFRGIKVKGDKLTRALSWANRAEAGKVVLVRGRWTEAYSHHYPVLGRDDQIDAVSLAVNMMDFRKREVYAF